MQMQIADEIFKRLDSLAQTLGTTSQYLYGTLVKQGFAMGLLEVAGIVTFLISLSIMLRGFKGVNFNEYDFKYPKTWARTMVCLLLCILIGMASLFNIGDLIYIYSPESYATERVIKILK